MITLRVGKKEIKSSDKYSSFDFYIVSFLAYDGAVLPTFGRLTVPGIAFPENWANRIMWLYRNSTNNMVKHIYQDCEKFGADHLDNGNPI